MERRGALLAGAVSLLWRVGLVSAAGAGIVGSRMQGDLVDRRLKGREITLLTVKARVMLPAGGCQCRMSEQAVIEVGLGVKQISFECHPVLVKLLMSAYKNGAKLLLVWARP